MFTNFKLYPIIIGLWLTEEGKAPLPVIHFHRGMEKIIDTKKDRSSTLRRIFGLMILGLLMALAIIPSGASAAGKPSNCMIPNGGDADNNGIGDVGVQVVCNYDSIYASDASGAYYWDLGDGRIYTSSGISSIADLDQTTLDTCYYRVHTQGTFNNDPYMDTGVISNMIRCSGYSGTSTYHYQIVDTTDPRYRGIPELSIWGNWEYHVLTESGSGNLARIALY